jgi:hypothetical protein
LDLDQEEALYEFLENTVNPFTMEQITSYVQAAGQRRNKRLVMEIEAYLQTRRIAFKLDNKRWLSRRGCFEPLEFVITPTRIELLNGILVPGHRCAPFANPLILPHRFEFFWGNKPIPFTTTEASPEDLYPFFCIYGEEFAPQYIARDNPKNEEAFNCDPYEDPPEVSIRTLDMRTIYRECSFVPGDCFLARTLDWKECRFELSKVPKDKWTAGELAEWVEAAEAGFENSFALLGAGASTEEQIAFAYWYGGQRMREVPAYSLEEFLYEKTDRIDTVPYGIETRFWFTGREIPDAKSLQNYVVPPDRTLIEDLLFKKNIPISEYVVLSYIKDAFFRNEKTVDEVINRIIPPVIHLEKIEWEIFTDYVSDRMEDFIKSYSLFLDQDKGPVRQRVAELHTAVIDLSARLQKGEIEAAWLPRHTFVVLSQIQGHAASLLEDLVFDDSPPESDIIAMDNSVDSMVETYGDIKELINNAMDNFRRSNLTIIHGGGNAGQLWWMIQISISGLDVWRRAIISHEITMAQMHQLIQISMNWSGKQRFRFYCEDGDDKQYLHDTIKLGDVDFHGKKELVYEYGPKWVIRILIMSSYQSSSKNNGEKDDLTRFVAGDGVAPPEQIEGPRHLNKILNNIGVNSLEAANNKEKQFALHEMGVDFVPVFDLEVINKRLREGGLGDG